VARNHSILPGLLSFHLDLTTLAATHRDYLPASIDASQTFSFTTVTTNRYEYYLPASIDASQTFSFTTVTTHAQTLTMASLTLWVDRPTPGIDSSSLNRPSEYFGRRHHLNKPCCHTKPLSPASKYLVTRCTSNERYYFEER